MIRRIRAVRVSYRTGFLVLALAALVWGVVTYVRIRDLVPAELAEPAEPQGP